MQIALFAGAPLYIRRAPASIAEVNDARRHSDARKRGVDALRRLVLTPDASLMQRAGFSNPPPSGVFRRFSMPCMASMNPEFALAQPVSLVQTAALVPWGTMRPPGNTHRRPTCASTTPSTNAPSGENSNNWRAHGASCSFRLRLARVRPQNHPGRPTNVPRPRDRQTGTFGCQARHGGGTHRRGGPRARRTQTSAAQDRSRPG